MNDRKNERVLAALRIAIGVFFCIFGEYKVFGTEFTLHGGFESAIRDFLAGGTAYPFVRPLLVAILAHYAAFVAFLVAYGELAIGVSLVAGVASRIASVFGLLLMILLWLSGGYPGAHAAFWHYWGASTNWSIFALCFLAFIFGRSEEVWSVKGLRRAG